MSETRPGVYLAFDPGDTTGVCVFDAVGEPIHVAQYTFTELDDYFFDFNPDTPVLKVICEDFRIFNHQARAFVNNKMVVTQVIGLIRSFARRRGADVVLQPPTIKKVAERLTGHAVVGAHSNSHFQDAYLHGAFWLIKNGIAESKLERETRLKNEAKGESQAGTD